MAWEKYESEGVSSNSDWYNFKDDVTAVIRVASAPIVYNEYYSNSEKKSFIVTDDMPAPKGMTVSTRYLVKALVWETFKKDGEVVKNSIGAKLVKLPWTIVNQLNSAADFDADYEFDEFPERLLFIKRTKSGGKYEYNILQKDAYKIPEESQKELDELVDPQEVVDGMIEKASGTSVQESDTEQGEPIAEVKDAVDETFEPAKPTKDRPKTDADIDVSDVPF